jgi:predicted kinase
VKVVRTDFRWRTHEGPQPNHLEATDVGAPHCAKIAGTEPENMLIILSGLPGVGKTTIARELARQMEAVHVRIDSIEAAILQSPIAQRSLDDRGYTVAYAVAADNLRVGRIVIADSVNPVPLTRSAWREVAARTGVEAVEVEVVCSNSEEHRRRVETRLSDGPGLTLLAWADVLERDYRPWDREPSSSRRHDGPSSKPSMCSAKQSDEFRTAART